ncbi:hypothetical protein MMC06_003931 [Schaereria dolodes]|nr:hypothetical protein [Schaereria dolodes]
MTEPPQFLYALLKDGNFVNMSSASPSLPPAKKRKRDEKQLGEIEVDIAAPEPPSKKALRRVKKAKITSISETSKQSLRNPESSTEEISDNVTTPKRSDYGIWIGNLPWTASKADLRKFLTEKAQITEDMITRLHMPTPAEATTATWRQKVKPQNKGFAYVDFSTAAALAKALSLSETLLAGRRVLIKDSKSFEGRPDKPSDVQDSSVQRGEPPSKRIFIGNLAFDMTKEDLEEHFARCGEIVEVFMATFEDTGKCKGYAWIEFSKLEAGEAAVRGWVAMEKLHDEMSEDDEVEESEKAWKGKKKVRKWWVNRIKGRPLRMEFAEDKAIRYKKRFRKSATDKNDIANSDEPVTDITKNDILTKFGDDGTQPGRERPLLDREPKGNLGRENRRGKKTDARTIKPGAALAAAPRLTGAIVESKGKKITFE